MQIRRLIAASSPVAATLLALFNQHAWGDPLHKVGSDGAWQHEQSGWVFPQQVGEFERVQPPYEIDGTYDVGARYEAVANAHRTRAAVHVYAKDSAAGEANFDVAKATAEGRPSGSTASPLEEEVCLIGSVVSISCRRVTFHSDGGSAGVRYLYFVEYKDWVVNIRTESDGSAINGAPMTDRFVRELDWSKLGTIPELHASK